MLSRVKFKGHSAVLIYGSCVAKINMPGMRLQRLTNWNQTKYKYQSPIISSESWFRLITFSYATIFTEGSKWERLGTCTVAIPF